MTLQESWGKHGGRGWSPASLKRTEEGLARPESLFPEDAVRSAVRGFYSEVNDLTQKAALGDPQVWLLPDLPENMRSAVAQALEAVQTRNEDALIDDEVATARAELVRHWVDTILDAWTVLRDGNRPLVLTTSLLPARVRGQDVEWQAWDARRKEDIESLLASIAVRSDDMDRLCRAFSESVSRAVEARGATLTLPQGLHLGKERRGFVVAV